MNEGKTIASSSGIRQEVERQMRIILKGCAQVIQEEELRERLERSLKTGVPLTVKLGMDPSAPDLHLGHAVVLRKLRQLQDLGHQIVIIIGDFTGKIGDPTGKAKGRRALSDREVLINAQTYQDQVFHVLDRDKTTVRYNGEWLELLTMKEILRLASTVTVARMLERDDFSNRYTREIPIGLHEFFYPLMQAYDSVAVKADIELGGTDQTFNILMGRSLQKDMGMEPQIALFMPILEGLDGKEKMSKSLGNYIGISEEPEVIFEKVMKIPDSLIIKYYNLCTDVHPREVAQLQKKLEEGLNPRDAKMMLANEITMLYHGQEAAVKAREHFKAAFQKNEVPENAPVLLIGAASEIERGERIINALVEKGFYKSKNEVRRIFRQGGVCYDGEKITDSKNIPEEGGEHVIKLGKGRFFRISSME